jgi:GMP synthase (glutamine-hydrolysing)
VSHLPILVVEHEAACPPAHVGAWLEDAGCVLEVVRPWRGEELPDLDGYAALLVLGGTMGANDDDRAPWLPRVRAIVREAARTDLPTLGICLGHQLVAVALGGSVVTNPHGQQLGLVETGWLPPAASDPLVSSRPFRGVQWNNDIVATLPDGAELLAATSAGEPQVIRFGPRMWGVQLHPEADEVVVGEWARGDREVHATRGIDQAAFLASIRDARAELDASWRPVLDRFARLADHTGSRATPEPAIPNGVDP